MRPDRRNVRRTVGQSHIEDEIDRANRVLEAQLGVAATRPGNHFTPSTMSIPVFALSWRIRLASP